MKNIVLLFILLFCTLQNGWSRCLRLTLNNGAKVYYQLGGEKSPCLRFGESDMTLDDDNYQFDGIAYFEILEEDAPTDLKRIDASLSLDGADEVHVFTLDGKEVDAQRLEKGIYVLQAGKSTIRLVKK